MEVTMQGNDAANPHVRDQYAAGAHSKSDATVPEGVAPDEEALFREFQAYVRAIYLEANKTVIQRMEKSVADFVKATDELQIAQRRLISKLFIGVVVLNIVVGVLVYLLATQR
jgi:hypothetical protein